MVTKEQAINSRYRQEFHYGECKKIIGPRGGITIHTVTVRNNGKCQTWKTRPSEFRLPVKYGLYNCTYIDNTNCQNFHLASECPLNSLTDEG